MKEKLNKKVALLLIALFCFIGMQDAKADYNGIGGSQSAGTPSCGTLPKLCQWNNYFFGIVQLKLVYYDGSDWEQIGKEYYIINEHVERDKNGKILGYGIQDSNGNFMYNKTKVLLNATNESETGGTSRVLTNGSLVECQYRNNKGEIVRDEKGNPKYKNTKNHGVESRDLPCRYNFTWLEKYFSGTKGTDTEKANAKTHINNFFKAIGVKPSDLDEQNDIGTGMNHVGYRILVEPVYNWVENQKGGNTEVLLTIKEALREVGTTNSNDYPAYSYLLHTEFNDIGIKAPSQKAGTDENKDRFKIASMENGYALNIINFDPSFINQCYGTKVTATNPKCENTNSQNQGTYKESFETVDCKLKEKNASKDGRKVKTMKNPTTKKSCKIYCTESVTVNYPGNVSPEIQAGGHFVWPTSKNGEMHNLNITGTRECKSLGAGCGNLSVNAKDVYKNFESSIDLEFKQGSTYNSNITLEKSVDTIECTGCDRLSDGGDITVTRKVSLKLPQGTYRYINKQTSVAVTSVSPLSKETYTDIGYGNLPVSKNASTNSNYKLKLTNIHLGANNIFGPVANDTKDNKVPYTCTYQAIKSPNTCVCPPGTTHAGEDLYCKISKNVNINCPTAQNQWCNDTRITIDDNCPPSDEYCPQERYKHISIKSCVTAGNSKDSCIARLCKDGGNKKYLCPPGTKKAGSNVGPCVESLISKGIQEADALTKCQSIECYDDGIPIIYRTISLKNPFPSKQINGRTKDFNTDAISGRYPGANWNSTELVKTKIRENRGVRDNNVYNKDPLYVIKLDAQTIRKIRTYNAEKRKGNNGGYGDFNLSCLETDGSKCLSKTFLRAELGNALEGGTCRNATTAPTFDSCVQ